MQSAYWYRIRRVPVSICKTNIVLGHAVLFLGRLSFIFGGALFSVTAFRRLPALEVLPPIHLLGIRGVLVFAVLFSLFCFALEIERIGNALLPPEALSAPRRRARMPGR